MKQFTFNSVTIADLDSVGTSDWAAVSAGLVALQVYLVGGVGEAEVEFDFSIDGAGAVPAVMSASLSGDTPGDGISFPVDAQNFPFVRMRVTELSGPGIVRAAVVFKEVKQCESTIPKRSGCGIRAANRTPVG